MLLILYAVLGSVAYAGLHYYVWRRLARDTGLPGVWRKRLALLFAVMVGSFPISQVAWKTGATTVAKIIGWPALLWMPLLALTVTLLAIADVGRLFGWGALRMAKADTPSDPDRRQFFNRALGGGVAVTATALSAQGMYKALTPPKVLDVPVVLDRLPHELDGFSIAQITDVHIGNTIGRDFVENMVAQVNAIGADLIAITGDLIDGPVRELKGSAAPLADLRAPHGVFFVTGNHEYYAGVNEWLEYLSSLGIRVLRNERVSIGNETASFDLAGIDDHEASRFGRGHGADLAKAVAGRDASRELVLLAHQPKQVQDAVKHGVGLQLSGHTHGGQIWPWHYAVMA